jgi:cell wall-associated NlpC family hydrolase
MMNHRPIAIPIIAILAFSVTFLLRAEPAAAPDAAISSNSDQAPVPTPAPSPTPAPAPAAAEGDAATTAANPATYTVAKGDTLWVISHKFHTSIKELKKINHLKKSALKPGQILKIPAGKTAKPAKTTTHAKKAKTVAAVTHTHHAQPVQDFDIPASTFASCPVPVTSDEADAPVATSDVESSPAPKMTPRATPVAIPVVAAPATVAQTQPTPSVSADSFRHTTQQNPAPMASTDSQAASPSSASKPASRGLFGFFFRQQQPAPVDWGARFTQAARDLSSRGLDYDDNWRPPGESHSWAMDCSNTTRYLYRETAGIELPRTASDQYYYLHLQNKAWDVPQTASGFADCNYLRQNLKPGDLLFWENTYRPERQPPITHVMVFLGTNQRGEWIMAGSQTSRGGEHNRRHGGPDVYVFNPTRPCGGYTTWFGLVHHQGRFCAYGRPLEADKSKLSVAAND